MFQPVIPVGGLGGWRFLQRTYDAQFVAFSQSVEIKRDSDYFREKVGGVQSAEELVSDRRLLTVALGAFGLQDDIDNRYFIKKILEDGTENDDALANRFADTRYRELSEAFGFGPTEFPKTSQQDFVESVLARYEASSFELATGAQDESMRFALYGQREMSLVAKMEGSNDTKWFTVMGDPPLRKLFERALNLPDAFGQVDIDQQLAVFKDRASSIFGSADLGQFEDPDKLQGLITKYLVGEQISSLGQGLSSGSIALTLLGR
ncbi:flagellar protein [Sulfitobacter sp. SK012]|uniref:DUF1217 domain-containing protein n=1 Tax=Sulfitobacter sp. SK012 TaxID=1389005 RepID=UPI000E09FB5B|nr:DUF1217 domain-containing protein [Sulfitobacter sp. SK012]AXI48604.1 flagellar protein [Sulfitobacter sp. SK012]